MNEAQILAYLESHAPLTRFYLFAPAQGGQALIKYFDAAGKSWNIMEDDDQFVAQLTQFLERSDVRVFNDYATLLKFEEESGLRN